MNHCEFCGKESTLLCDGPVVDGERVSMEAAVGSENGAPWSR